MLFEIHSKGYASAETLMGAYPDFHSALTVYRCEADAWAIIPTGRADELERFGNLYSIAPRYYGGMYVLKCGDGCSCLGFDVADRKGRAMAAWAGVPFGRGAGLPVIGTPDHYASYVAAMAAGRAKATKTGQRCPVELTPELIPFEGQRVRVTYPDGSASRFRVGKSTGWAPCHLEIKGRSLGGAAVYFPHGATVALDTAKGART